MNKTVRIIFFVAAFVTMAILLWCHRVFCRRNETKSTTTPRLLIKKNWNRRRTRPTSASPLRDLPSKRERSASYLPLISPHSSKPPPLGFTYSTSMPKPEISKTIGFSSHADAGPSTSGASYPPNLKNNRDSCPTPPYPLFNIMPRPSTSRTSCPPERIRSETPDSVRSIPYSPIHEAAYPLPNGGLIPISSRAPAELNTHEDINHTNITPYLSAHEAPCPLRTISAVTQQSYLTPYPPEHTTLCEIQDSTGNTPSAPFHEASYQLSNRSSLPQFTTESSVESNAHHNRTTSYPPANTTSISVEQRPPSYAEAVHNKF